MGVAPGDGVVVPQLTFYASAETIPPTGARPVLCGIDLETFCTTAETAKASLTPRTEAAIAVRAFWNLAPVAEIEALGVPVLEDAAQVAGTTTSSGRAQVIWNPSYSTVYLRRRAFCALRSCERQRCSRSRTLSSFVPFEGVIRSNRTSRSATH